MKMIDVVFGVLALPVIIIAAIIGAIILAIAYPIYLIVWAFVGGKQ